MIIFLAVLLIWEALEARRFVRSREAIIESIIEARTTINNNAAIQERQILFINNMATSLDSIEKILEVHSNVLQLYGPALAYLDREKFKVDKIGD
jgi:hypothetical protein